MSVFVAVYRSTFFKLGSGVTVPKILSLVHHVFICTTRLDVFVLSEDLVAGRPHVLIHLYHTSLYVCTI